MKPFLQEGDILLVEMNHFQFQVGDIALLSDSTQSELIAHRIISLSPFKTKGDNKKLHDENFTPMGRVIGRKRNADVIEWRENIPPYGKLFASKLGLITYIIEILLSALTKKNRT